MAPGPVQGNNTLSSCQMTRRKNEPKCLVTTEYQALLLQIEPIYTWLFLATTECRICTSFPGYLCCTSLLDVFLRTDRSYENNFVI